jgi:hypothetical protein
LLLVQNAIIPIANKVIPRKIKASIDYEARMANAAEQSNRLMSQMVELQRTASLDHGKILAELSRHSESLGIILDRLSREIKKAKAK